MNRDDTLRRRFAANLREAMDAEGLNQSELGRRLKTQQSDVSGWLLEGRIPRGPLLARLCETLNVSADWLLLGRGSRQGGLPTVHDSFFDGWRLALQEARTALEEVERRGRGATPSPSVRDAARVAAATHATLGRDARVRKKPRKSA